ncbi:MAG: hypothetical protein ACLGH8_02255 [Bacteroidia bacterium]
MEPPTLPDWLASNPGSSINDYYRTFPVKRETLTAPRFEPQISSTSTTPSYRTLITSAIVCSIGFIGYFSPWFSIPVLHISVSGHEIIQMFNFFVNRKESLADIQDYVKFLYLIPVTYVLVVLGAAARSYFLIAIGTVCNIMIVAVAMKYILDLPTPILNSMSIGLYLVLISIIGQLYNVFTINFYKSEK